MDNPFQHPADELDDLTAISMANASDYSFREILDMLAEQPDLILTIPSDQVNELKRGLAARKSKDTYKLKEQGIVTAKETMKFTIYPAKNSEGQLIPDMTCVRVKVGPRAGITIADIKTPEEDALFSSPLTPVKG